MHLPIEPVDSHSINVEWQRGEYPRQDLRAGPHIQLLGRAAVFRDQQSDILYSISP